MNDDDRTFDKAWDLAKEILKEDEPTALSIVTLIASVVLRIISTEEKFEDAVELHAELILDSPKIDDDDRKYLLSDSSEDVADKQH